MNKDTLLMEALESRAKRREERRAFIRATSGAAVAVAGASLLSACGGGSNNDNRTPPPTGTPQPPRTLTDGDILNFALNLEYLEAQFYSFAVSGTGLPEGLLGGSGTRGQATGGRQVTFTDPQVAAYAREIAADERAHVQFLRNAIGGTAIAQPAIDIGTGPNSAFSNAARAAGLIGAGASFDVYANDENFLLGAFIFEDVGVTAYKGASPLINDRNVLGAAAGILAAEAYHAGLVRTALFTKGIRTQTTAISNARDSLDGASDLDQGVTSGTGATLTANIVPADANAIAFSRDPGQVLNIVFLTRTSVTRGGFFPSGVNGVLTNSGAN